MIIPTAEKLYNQVEIAYDLLVNPLSVTQNRVWYYIPAQIENFIEVDTTLELLDIIGNRIVHNTDTRIILDIVHNTILYIQKNIDFFNMTDAVMVWPKYPYRLSSIETRFFIHCTDFAHIHEVYHRLEYRPRDTILHDILPNIVDFF